MDRRTLLIGSLGYALPAFPNTQSSGKSVCLMIGVEKYDNPRVSPLQYAAKDVTAVANVLKTKFSFSDVRLMTTDTSVSKDLPKSTNVLKVINQLVQTLEASDTFVFYFSGHGYVRDGKTFLATQDADPSDSELLERTTLPLESLQKRFKQLRARQVIMIIDACRNDPEKGKGDRDNLLQRDLSKDLRFVAEEVSTSSGGGSAILFACSEGERAYEDEEFGQSVFTKYLLEAFDGKAASLSVDDVVAYTASGVQKWAKVNGNRQTPDLHKFGTGKLAFGSANVIVHGGGPVTTSIRLELTGVPVGAKVTLDGTPLTGSVFTDNIVQKSKSVMVAVIARGYKHYLHTVVIPRGGSVVHKVLLEAKPKSSNNLADYPALNAYVKSLRTIHIGTLAMGSLSGRLNEKPRHDIRIAAFRMGATPVTVAVWKEYCLATDLPLPIAPDWGLIDNHPVVNVSWTDIMGSDGKSGFCRWASDIVGLLLTLPTEAQWEYAARGGNVDQEFPWGDTFDRTKLWCSVRNFGSAGKTAPVNRSINIYRNSFGLTDMAGNVWQWCSDLYSLYSTSNESDLSKTHSTADDDRVIRGGSWDYPYQDCFRCAHRERWHSSVMASTGGFRLVSGPR